MDFQSFLPREISLSSKAFQRLASFLDDNGLRLEPDLIYAAGVFNEHEELIACGGFSKSVIKCVAVRSDYRNCGLLARIVTHLYTLMLKRGINNVFVFTNPDHVSKFTDLNFYLVAQTDRAALLETQKDGIDSYVERVREQLLQALHSLRKCSNHSIIGSVVINANPFTNGHLYLLEQAATSCHFLMVFFVSDDRSVFPSDVRYKLIVDGTRHISNMLVIPTSDYIISSASFPGYFLKSADEICRVQAALDLTVFAGRIAKPLEISVRFAGSEPLDATTAAYHEKMCQLLPKYNIDVKIFPRCKLDGKVISASRVRGLLQQGRLNEVERLVPLSTWTFLTSQAGRAIRC